MKSNRALPEPFDSLLKFFASVQLTVFVLLILAATSIIGTLIPQNQQPRDYLHAFGEFYYQLFAVLDFFDMYHSWWFQLLLMILTLNILVCSLDRLPGIWRMIFAPANPLRPSRFRNAPARAEFVRDHSPTDSHDRVQRIVSRVFGTLKQKTEGAKTHFFGEKWRWNRLGVYVVHFSVILLLVGGIIGSLYGFDGFVNVAEGETVDTIRLRGTDQMLRLPFQIRCDDFDVSFYETGEPKEFRSKLTLLTPAGEELLSKDIIVNDPLRYQGISLYQASYGKLDPQPAAGSQLAATKFSLNFQSSASGMGYVRNLKINDTVDLPEKLGTFTLLHYLPQAEFGGQSMGEAIVGLLKSDSGQEEQILLPLQFPNFDKMRQGQVILSVVAPLPGQVGGGGAPEERFFTGLSVTKDPGVWVVYSGFILMIAGCFITFFMPHQQILVTVKPDRAGSRIAICGLAPPAIKWGSSVKWNAWRRNCRRNPKSGY